MTYPTPMRGAAGFAVALLIAAPAAVAACPVCESATGTEVRARVFDDRFGETLALISLPFAVVAGGTALVNFAGEPRKPAGRDANPGREEVRNGR